MKKKVILAMCIAAALALAGCGNKNEAAKTDDGQEAYIAWTVQRSGSEP